MRALNEKFNNIRPPDDDGPTEGNSELISAAEEFGPTVVSRAFNA